MPPPDAEEVQLKQLRSVLLNEVFRPYVGEPSKAGFPLMFTLESTHAPVGGTGVDDIARTYSAA